MAAIDNEEAVLETTFPKFKIPKPEVDEHHWWDWESIRSYLRSKFGRASSEHVVQEVSNERWIRVSDIPKCHLNCIYEYTLDRGCAYSDFFCICTRLDQVMTDFERCAKSCDGNQDQIWGPGAIQEFCDNVNVRVELPRFMTQYQHLRRRQFESSAGFGDFNSDGIFSSAGPPEPTTTVVITTTLSYGDASYSYFTSGGDDGQLTEIIGQPDTRILFTDSVTSTLASGAVGFTSTFTNLFSPDITVIVGAPAAETTSGGGKGDQSSPSKGTANPTYTPPPAAARHGLATGAKIGIGVAVPLIVLVFLGIGIFFFLRRRKQRKGKEPPREQEKDDGGLPENVTSIPELPKHPSYVGVVEPVSVHELNAHEVDPYSPKPAEIQGTPRHEIDESTQPQLRHEADTHTEPRHELTSSPSLAPSSVVRKPVSPAPAYSYPSAPAPWEDHGYDSYQTPANAPLTEEELELQRQEEELAQVKLRKERLQNLQLLEEREEALIKSIAEKKKKGGPSGS